MHVLMCSYCVVYCLFSVFFVTAASFVKQNVSVGESCIDYYPGHTDNIIF
jgi:hypothetical protein